VRRRELKPGLDEISSFGVIGTGVEAGSSLRALEREDAGPRERTWWSERCCTSCSSTST
jgi:hypothetical protein